MTYKIVDIKAKCCSICRFHNAVGECLILQKKTEWAEECKLTDAMQRHDAQTAIKALKEKIRRLEDA